MTKTPIVAFLLGAFGTVAVYETTDAHLLAREHTSQVANVPRAQQAGQPNPDVALTQARPPRSTRPDHEVARLREEAITQRGRAELAEGQLEAIEGHEIPWPRDVASEYKEDAVTKQLQEFVVNRGLAKIKNIDCSEYPCVETLQLPDTSPQAMQKLHEALNEMVKQYYNGSVALAISSSQSGLGSDAVSMAGVSVMPNDEDVKARVRNRNDPGSH